MKNFYSYSILQYAIIHARKAVDPMKQDIDTARDMHSVISVSSIMGLIGGAATPAYNNLKGQVLHLTCQSAIRVQQSGGHQVIAMLGGYDDIPSAG